MRYDAESLYALLPAFHRIRDVAHSQMLEHEVVAGETLEAIAIRYKIAATAIRAANPAIDLDPPAAGRRLVIPSSGPLRELLALIAEQLAALEEDIDQLHDNAFIETCAEWAVPYLGDLIGYRPLHGAGGSLRSFRAEVANTIGFRRRKGTAAMLEQLARDLTGWDAAAVEFFLRLAATQHLNHLRPSEAGTLDLRSMEPLERLGTAFDRMPHFIDVRRIASGRGRHNISNIGLFLFRLRSFSWTAVRAQAAAAGDARRFLFHPLAINTQLFTRPETETAISHLATPRNVPLRLSRRELRRRLDDYYGADKSFLVLRRVVLPPGSFGPDLVPVPIEEIESCDLSDLDADPDTSTWPAGHATRVNVDPELGRIRTPADEQELVTIFHTGFIAQLGGGEYSRLETFAADPSTLSRFPGAHSTLQATINAQANSGAVEIEATGPLHETPVIACAANALLEIRAADRRRPTLVLGGDLVVAGGDSSEVALNGILITGGRIVVPAMFNGSPNRLQKLRLVHCTLSPGLTLHRDGQPVTPDAPSIIVESPDTELEVSWSITGGIRAVDTAVVHLEHSIIDGNGPTRIAYAAPPPNENNAGAPVNIESCTLIGKVHTTTILLASNSLFFSENAAGDGWAAPVIARRRQQGCVRFSFVPWTSIVPRRYRCHPANAEEAALLDPIFASLRFGNPGYGGLAGNCAPELWRGADDGAEVGAFHHLQQPQRVSDLNTRLDEYLRFGLEAGVFYET